MNTPVEPVQAAMSDVDRQAVIARLQAALWAVENGDEAAWRARVDELIQWRAQPLVRALGRLARELARVLGDDDNRAPGTSLPEACARLQHVVKLTESASLHTLDLIEECGRLIDTLAAADTEDRATKLAAMRARLSEMTMAQSYQDLTGQIILRVVALMQAVHAGLGDALPGDETAGGRSACGPAVAGLDASTATQDDANDLLSSLGI